MAMVRPAGSVSALVLCLVAATSCAEDGNGADEASGEFPEGDITLIVPYETGGSNDVMARLLAPLMAEELGVTIGVENVVGASGAVALGEVYEAEPDGHTLLAYTPPNEYIAEVQGLLDVPEDGFRMLGAGNVDPGLIAVPPDSPYETLEELNEASAEEDLSVAVHGLASNYTVGALSYMNAVGVDWSLVHNDGGGDITTAVQGGHTDVGVRAGGWDDLHPDELRVLAVMNEERVDDFDGVPTVEEAVGERVIMNALRGFAVHSDTPDEIFDVLAEAFAAGVDSDEYRDSIQADLGLRWEYLTPEEAEEVRDEAAASVDAVVDDLDLEQ